jgi:hypothetical protein
MSAAGNSEVLRPILLRSMTPGAYCSFLDDLLGLMPSFAVINRSQRERYALSPKTITGWSRILTTYTVLKYLDDMEKNRPDNTPPRSIADPTEFGSPRSQSQRVRSPSQRSQAKSPLIYTNGGGTHAEEVEDDIASDVQEGTRSELGEEHVSLLMAVIGTTPEYVDSESQDLTILLIPSMNLTTLAHPLVI